MNHYTDMTQHCQQNKQHVPCTNVFLWMSLLRMSYMCRAQTCSNEWVCFEWATCAVHKRVPMKWQSALNELHVPCTNVFLWNDSLLWMSYMCCAQTCSYEKTVCFEHYWSDSSSLLIEVKKAPSWKSWESVLVRPCLQPSSDITWQTSTRKSDAEEEVTLKKSVIHTGRTKLSGQSKISLVLFKIYLRSAPALFNLNYLYYLSRLSSCCNSHNKANHIPSYCKALTGGKSLMIKKFDLGNHCRARLYIMVDMVFLVNTFQWEKNCGTWMHVSML